MKLYNDKQKRVVFFLEGQSSWENMRKYQHFLFLLQQLKKNNSLLNY